MSEDAAEALRARMRDLDVEVAEGPSDLVRCRVEAADAYAMLGRLREDEGAPMRRVLDLTAIDRGGSPRFEVVYQLHSPGPNVRLQLRVPVDGEPPTLDSVVPLWRSASWLEREVFDLFGIHFRGHPDPRRILLPEDFEGAPLRKDHPRQPDVPLPKGVDR